MEGQRLIHPVRERSGYAIVAGSGTIITTYGGSSTTGGTDSRTFEFLSVIVAMTILSHS